MANEYGSDAALGYSDAFDIISRAPGKAMDIGMQVRNQRLAEQQARELIMASRREEARAENDRARVALASPYGGEPLYRQDPSGPLDLLGYGAGQGQPQAPVAPGGSPAAAQSGADQLAMLGYGQQMLGPADLGGISVAPELGAADLADILIGPQPHGGGTDGMTDDEIRQFSLLRARGGVGEPAIAPASFAMAGGVQIPMPASVAPPRMDNMPSTGFSGDVPTLRQWARVGGRTGTLSNPLLGVISQTPDYLPSPGDALFRMKEQQRLGQWTRRDKPEDVADNYSRYIADLTNEYNAVTKGALTREGQASQAQGAAAAQAHDTAREQAIAGLMPVIRKSNKDLGIPTDDATVRAQAIAAVGAPKVYGGQTGQVSDTTQTRISSVAAQMQAGLARDKFTEDQRLLREQERQVEEKSYADTLQATAGPWLTPDMVTAPSGEKLLAATAARMQSEGFAFDPQTRTFRRTKDGVVDIVDSAAAVRQTGDVINAADTKARRDARAVALEPKGREATVAPRGAGRGGMPVDIGQMQEFLMQRGFTAQEAASMAVLVQNDPTTAGRILAAEAKGPILKIIREKTQGI